MTDRAAGHATAATSSTRAGIGELRAYFDAFWMQALAAFKEAVENPTEEAA